VTTWGPARVVAATAYLATVLAICSSCGVAGSDASPSAPRPSRVKAIVKGVRFIGSVDTMKLSKDRADNLSPSEVNRVVDLLARSLSTTHVSVDTHLEQPSVIGSWANRIHSDRKHVWFRLGSSTCNQPHGDLADGYPNYRPGYLTALHELMLAHPGYFRSGDILDGDAEAENSCWWTDHYGCGVQSACRPCSGSASDIPCAPIRQFNAFLADMTRQENIDLAAMRIAGVATNVHSTDPGTAMKILRAGFVRSMHNLITVDAYPDHATTHPIVAAKDWSHELARWHGTWLRRGLNVSILLGEWGYSLETNVDDATQRSVIQSEVSRAFRPARYLVGTNYWVGPGMAGDGGYTQILSPDGAGGWRFRPAAGVLSSFYAAMNARRRPG
jgi:hypothetical protein